MSFSFSTVPLKPGEEIRILRLAPKAPRLRGFRRLLHVPCPSWKVPRADRLHGELVAISLAHPPEYTALSYTWGDPTFDSEIIVNGRHLPITSSLETALRTLQGSADDAEYLSLWIDQICINQNDTNEKSVQVPLMKQIYASATQTLAWLGPAADRSDLVMDFLNTIGEEGVKVGLQDITDEDGHRISRALAADPGWLHRSSNAASSESEFEGLIRKLILQHGEGEYYLLPLRHECLSLFQRQYFQRGWIKQEVAIPSRLILQCGSKTIEAKAFEATIVFLLVHFQIIFTQLQLNQLKPLPVQEHNALLFFLGQQRDVLTEVIFPLIRNRDWFHNPEKRGTQTLSYLIHDYRARTGFTEPRDRIYGMLGLACDVDTLGIEVDYRKPWEEVYTDAFRRTIVNGNGSDWKVDSVLSMVKYPKTSDRLPSWVPDLNVTHSTTTQRTTTLLQANTTQPFAAAGSTSYLPPSSSSEAPLHILVCQGVVVDSICRVGRQWEWKEEDGEQGLLGAFLPCSDIVDYIESTPMVPNHPHAASPARRAEGAWRIPVTDHEYINASIGTSRRCTAASFKAYQDVINMHIWANALKLGQDIADVIPLTNEQKDELEMVSEQEREGKANQMRAERLTHVMSNEANLYFSRMNVMQYRRPFVATGGFVGLGPSEMESGDLVCVLHGARVPFVLRPCQDGEGKQYSLVGECYCDGIMDGEALKMGLEEEEFRVA